MLFLLLVLLFCKQAWPFYQLPVADVTMVQGKAAKVRIKDLCLVVGLQMIVLASFLPSFLPVRTKNMVEKNWGKGLKRVC